MVVMVEIEQEEVVMVVHLVEVQVNQEHQKGKMDGQFCSQTLEFKVELLLETMVLCKFKDYMELDSQIMFNKLWIF
jgi:hypothetical protein